jgi:type IV pilus assembly protein PilY1
MSVNNMNPMHRWTALFALIGVLGAIPIGAQTTTFSEDFTGANTTNNWYFFGGACLTAGTTSSSTNPGLVPSCTSLLSSYYSHASSADPYLVGGNSGYLGSSTAPASISGQVPDPVGSGALRFTNGSVLNGSSYQYGFNERGAILSSSTFPTGAGIQVTFKTVTYHGNAGGAGGDGADGISFFLQDGAQAPGLGAFGGSLAYSCSNSNTPHDGLTGGYIGLGIDEYGNFLNGTNLVSGYTGTNVATGDNTAYGYGYKPGRIGLRGAGSISFAALTAAYGTNPGSTSLPYYPLSLATSCLNAGGTYSSAGGNCIDICSAGSTYDATTGVCNKACTGSAVYSSSTDTCNSCATGTYNSTTQQCMSAVCPAAGYATGTYNSGSGQCTNSCPTGYTLTGTSCYPTGSVYSTGYYCPSGSTIVSNSGVYVCYPTVSPALSYSAGYYCPSGLTISGTSCYITGDSHNATTTKYCPSGQTINSAGTLCYPTGDSNSATTNNYCPSGQTINSAGTLCYPTGDSNSSTTNEYCPSGKTISSTGTFCYPTATPANVYGAGFYCPNGDATPTSAGECCPSGYAYNTTSHVCTKSGSANVAAVAATAATAASPMSAATAMGAATAMSAATAATPATAVSAAQTVTAASRASTETAPQTLAPTTGNVDSQYAVQNTCASGNLYNYSTANAPSNAGTATLTNAANTAGVLDYAPIPNAYTELTSFQIANESAATRGAATPIFYTLQITQDGLLSFAYSVSGGAYSYLIKNQSITASNGPLPASFRVGFAGSDGGATNVHEIMCFKAAAANQSGSSASVNQKQASKVEAGTQAYFAYYNPNDWTGTVTANNLIDTGGVVTVASTANWDASCVLTGTGSSGCANTGASGPTGAIPAPSGRVMLTWDTAANTGIPFEWASLNNAQQAALTFGDASPSSARLSYLRGDRSNEINTVGVGLYRARDAVLGDIIDSSPTWVGPPSSPYTSTWIDHLYPATAMPENSGSQSYLQFSAAEQTRLNVVYTGSNDGFLHGFEAGSFDANGNFVANGTTPNDGKEVLAYMPGSMLASAALPSAAGGCLVDTTTATVVQNIHGVTPAVGATPECVGPLLDYSNSQYGHNFFVDGTPGSGDLFYEGQWHTWLVGGLGVGGAAIFALDVTNPSNFTESGASSLVIGEWNAGSIACSNVSNCGTNLGNTFGTPLIRRLHDGNWAIIFGNGFGSTSGDAGVYIITINSSTGAQTTYYLSTNTPGTANGIAYVTAADLDGDHITDYLYAGDLLGHVWRFDLTSHLESNWAAATAPLFTTQSGQPITTAVLAISSTVAGGAAPQVLIEFGTGERTQLTNLAPEQYIGGVQSIYGVWDWNMSEWDTLEPGASYASLTASTAATGLSTPFTLTSSNLQAQTLTPNANGVTVDGTNIAICWQGSLTPCGTGTFGWYANLPGTQEQIIYSPVYYLGAFIVNSTIPANNLATSCTSNLDTGYTYALNIANGGVFTNVFPTYTKNGTLVTDSNEAGILTNASGSNGVVTTSQGTTYLVSQGIDGIPVPNRIGPPSNTKAKRLTWIENR